MPIWDGILEELKFRIGLLTCAILSWAEMFVQDTEVSLPEEATRV